MCRWLAYRGNPIHPAELVLHPVHSLVAPSLVMFHLALTHGLTDDPVAALTATIGQIEAVGRDHGVRFPFQGTVAVTDGTTIWAVRYSSEGRTRSLFHSVDVATLDEMYPELSALSHFGDGARVIVSQPLTDLPGAFHEVPEATLAVLAPDGYEHRPFTPAA